MRFRSMWISWSLIGSRCQSTIMALAAAVPATSTSKMVLWPVSEKRIREICLGSTSTATGIVAGAIKHGRNLARNAHAARGILVELALTGLGYDYFRHLFSRFLVSGTEAAFSVSLSSLC